MTDKRIMDSLQSLSYVSVRRKTYAPKDFEQCKCILLTENNTTKRISKAPEISKNGVVPLCTDLFYFTNRLWTRLGKGFGETITPSIFTASSKARIILASKLDMIVSEEYDKLCKEYEAGKLSDEQASSYLYRLKSMAKKPEEIESSDIVDLDLSVNGSRLELHIQEKALKEAEHEKTVKMYAAQSKLMSKYEKQEAKTAFDKQFDIYRISRNNAYKEAICDNRRIVNIIIMLVAIAILLGTLLRLSGTGVWASVLYSVATLLPGLIWYLLKKESVVNSFRYCFNRTARIELKKRIISELLKNTTRPSLIGILAGIKERNGRNDAE